jgi:hypothetical protein
MKDPTAETALANIERELKLRAVDPKQKANIPALRNAKLMIEELKQWQQTQAR